MAIKYLTTTEIIDIGSKYNSIVRVFETQTIHAYKPRDDAENEAYFQRHPNPPARVTLYPQAVDANTIFPDADINCCDACYYPGVMEAIHAHLRRYPNRKAYITFQQYNVADALGDQSATYQDPDGEGFFTLMRQEYGTANSYFVRNTPTSGRPYSHAVFPWPLQVHIAVRSNVLYEELDTIRFTDNHRIVTIIAQFTNLPDTGLVVPAIHPLTYRAMYSERIYAFANEYIISHNVTAIDRKAQIANIIRFVIAALTSAAKKREGAPMGLDSVIIANSSYALIDYHTNMSRSEQAFVVPRSVLGSLTHAVSPTVYNFFYGRSIADMETRGDLILPTSLQTDMPLLDQTHRATLVPIVEQSLNTTTLRLPN